MADIEFNCPQCKGSVLVDGKNAGLIVFCKKCSAPILVPTQPPEQRPASESNNSEIKSPSIHEHISQASHLYKPIRSSLCPYCQAKIVSNAVLCLKCGRNLRTGSIIADLNKPSNKSSTFPIVSSLVLFIILSSVAIFYFTDYDTSKLIGFIKVHILKSGIDNVSTNDILQNVTLDTETITTTEGVTYNNCKIMLVQPDALIFSHSTGTSRIPFDKLPANLANHYGYDPQKASEHVKIESGRREAETARQLNANASKPKSVKTNVACPVCDGKGYRVSQFNHRHIKCLNCGGDGSITKITSVPPSP